MKLSSHPDIFTRMARAACAAAVFCVLGLGGAAIAQPSLDGYFANFVAANPPQPAPDVPFVDYDGVKHKLSDYRGRVVLLNFWATWCPACAMEMPALDRLQAQLGGDEFAVVAVSQSSGGAAAVNRFLQTHGVNHVSVFIDEAGSLGSALAQDMLPTSYLVDAQGQVVGHLVGPADWHSPQAIALIRFFMRQSGQDMNQIRPRGRAW